MNWHRAISIVSELVRENKLASVDTDRFIAAKYHWIKGTSRGLETEVNAWLCSLLRCGTSRARGKRIDSSAYRFIEFQSGRAVYREITIEL